MNYRINPKQIIFFISYAIFVLLVLTRTTFFYQFIVGKAFNGVLALCVFMAILGEIALGKSTMRMMIGVFIFMGFIALSIFVKATFYLILSATVILIYCSRDIPFRKIACFSAWILSAALFVVIFSSRIGIIQDYVEETGKRVRHFLGFLFALYPSTVAMNISMLSVYVRRNRIMWIEILCLLAGNFWIFKMTGSRLSFIISVVTLAFAAFLKVFPHFLEKKKKLKYVLALSYLIFASVSLIVSVKYDHDVQWETKVNRVLSDRLRLQNIAMEEYGFSVFGQDIHANGYGLTVEGERNKALLKEEYFYVDNIYVQWFVKNGIAFFAVMLAVLTAMAFRSVLYERQGYLLFMLTMMAIFCLIQDTILFVHFNTFVLCAGNLLLGNKNEIELETEDNYHIWFEKKRKYVYKRYYQLKNKFRNGVRW